MSLTLPGLSAGSACHLLWGHWQCRCWQRRAARAGLMANLPNELKRLVKPGLRLKPCGSSGEQPSPAARDLVLLPSTLPASEPALATFLALDHASFLSAARTGGKMNPRLRRALCRKLGAL